MTDIINRRKAMTAIAVAPAAVALPVSAAEGPSELATLIRRYWEGEEAYSDYPGEWASREDEDGFARLTAM